MGLALTHPEPRPIGPELRGSVLSRRKIKFGAGEMLATQQEPIIFNSRG